MKKAVYFILVSLLLFASCKKEDSIVNPSEKPIVKIINPTNNQIIKDSVTIEIEASDVKGITKVLLFIDNIIVKEFIDQPYRYYWDVKSLPDSSIHTIYAKAFNSDNDSSGSVVINVSLKNVYAQVILTTLWSDGSTNYPLKNAKVFISSENGITVNYTDETGKLELILSSENTYSFLVQTPHPDDNKIFLRGSLNNVKLTRGEIRSETIITKPTSSFGISINEIYSSGPVNSIFYFYDQFIELYNSSDSIKYLDGLLVMRFAGIAKGADENNDGDIDGVTYIFKFPGNPGEKNYPFHPKTFLVLAQDAENHKNTISTSYDLSNANWEFYNQVSANDIDNPSVPNLINMKSESTADFMINLFSDAVVLADGMDTVWEDGIKIETIIDGVQYLPDNLTSKTLDERVDKRYVISPPRYRGLSMKRREPGWDTNNSSNDFNQNHTSATPGYQ